MSLATYPQSSAPYHQPPENLDDLVAKLFLNGYLNTNFLIKASGAEIRDPSFTELIKGIQHVRNETQNITYMPVGGGVYIDDAWNAKHPDEPRPKKDGIGITTEEVLIDGVIPGARAMDLDLRKTFGMYGTNLSVNYIPGRNIIASIKDFEKYGFVGEIKEIHGLDPTCDVNVIPFVGVDANDAKQPLNINADDIFRYLAKKIDPSRAFLLTASDGVKDMAGDVVPMITDESIQRILQETHPEIPVDGGMRKKIEEVKRALEYLNRITIISSRGFLKEIIEVGGHGTMAIRSDMQSAVPLLKAERVLFEKVNADRVVQGKFRPRTEDEFEEVCRHHKLIKVDSSVLGGYSLMPRGKSDAELACLWAGNIGNGVGKWVLDDAKARAAQKGQNIWAITGSKSAGGAFQKSGFEFIGFLHLLLQKDNFIAPDFVKNYDPEAAKPKEGKGKAVYRFKTINSSRFSNPESLSNRTDYNPEAGIRTMGF